MLTPHMTELARQLAVAGAEVHYVAEKALSADRRAMGWVTDEIPEVNVHIVTTTGKVRDLIDRLPKHAVHITQGVRANGLVADAQKRIIVRGLRHYPIMEQVDLRGAAGRIKLLVYALRFWALSGCIDGLLAIGEGTPAWVARLSPKSLRVSPFAYFLKGKSPHPMVCDQGVFRFIFVGSLIELKRVDLLIDALSGLCDWPFDLEIVGAGPECTRLENRAGEMLPGRVAFAGVLPMEATIARIAAADCLVLPSDHDGWGAVISEAQINGTPAICSSACGAAGTVRASGFGAVFEAGDVEGLRRCLAGMMNKGRIDKVGREELSKWAQSLTAETGARYLLEIIRSARDAARPIIPPWDLCKAFGRGVPA